MLLKSELYHFFYDFVYYYYNIYNNTYKQIRVFISVVVTASPKT